MRDARIRIGVFLWRGCGCRMCSFLVACGCLDVVFRRSDRHCCFSVQKWSSCCVRPANRGASHEKGSFAVRRTSNGELFGRRTGRIIPFPLKILPPPKISLPSSPLSFLLHFLLLQSRRPNNQPAASRTKQP